MILALVALPALAAVAAFLIRSHYLRRSLLVAVSVVHASLVGLLWVDPWRFPAMGSWLAADALGRLFLGIASLLFLAVSVSAVGFLQKESGATSADSEEGFLFSNAPEAVFTACLLGFLSTMTLVTVSQHFGLLWVSIEATTLVSAPLIHYHRHHRSLEATWKYLLVCSVGIAVALLGTYFLAASVPSAAAGAKSAATSLTFSGLTRAAASLDAGWLKAAFLLLLVGYGTKMGLAPMHTWLPDAHSEAPSVVSALLSGALLNCAFLAVLRILSVCAAAGLGAFGRQTILVLGLVSMAVAAGLIIGQPDYKRMLAYSSVEHMGILCVGIGLGGLGDWGALFHAVNHSFTKAALFLLAGNFLAAYGTKKSSDVDGAARTLPVTAALWVAGLFAITGAPPFGVFSSELTILRAGVNAGAWVVVVIYSVLLAAVFVGMITMLLRMGQVGRTDLPSQAARVGSAAAGGRGNAATAPGAQGSGRGMALAVAAARPLRAHDSALSVAAPLLLLVLTGALGLYIPGFLDTALKQAALLLGV
jgi:hydrogenase-4 component F